MKGFNKKAALISAFIAVFYAPFIFYSGVFVPTTFVIFTYVLSAFVFQKIRENPSAARFFLFGIIVGLATLVRVSILAFAAAVLIWAIFTFKSRRISLSRRRKYLWGRTRTNRYRSPGGPLFSPGCPSPPRRILVPSSTPAGIETCWE